MATFYLIISDGSQKVVEIQAANTHEAVNDAFNALTQFACQKFPPPENVSIDVHSEDRKRLATVKFSFEVDYADQFRV
jgi:hypothetical protein